MRTYNAVPGEPLPLGHRYEHHARRIVFDISGWVEAFGAGTVTLLHQRQGDEVPYPVAVTRTDADGTANDQTGTLVLWDVTNTDTYFPCHYGKAELRYYLGTGSAPVFLVKSDIYKTVVENTLGAELAEAPEEEREWLDVLLEAANRIESAEGAATVAHEAAASAEAAASTAEAAARTAEAAQTAAEEAKRILEEFGATAAAQFSNASFQKLTDGGGFTLVLSASYSGTAGGKAEVHAEIPLYVVTATTGSDYEGWAINEATVTARCVSDGTPLARQPSWTLRDGRHVLHAQWGFAVAEAESHRVQVQLSVTGGTAGIAAGDAVMFVGGIIT